jgi:hypothetical protein
VRGCCMNWEFVRSRPGRPRRTAARQHHGLKPTRPGVSSLSTTCSVRTAMRRCDSAGCSQSIRSVLAGN